MSAYTGPEIINDGLAMCLDTGNSKSYPGSGATWSDISGSGRNFTGNASYINSSRVISGATWTCSSSLVSNLLNSDTFSIFFYIRFNSSGTYPSSTTGAWNKIFEHAPAGTDRSPGVWRYPSQRLIHWRYDAGNTGLDFGRNTNTDEFAVDTWYYIGQTKSGATAKAYVNGVEVASGGVVATKFTGNADINLLPGYPADICSLNGLSIHSTALSADNIFKNFAASRGRYGL